MNALVPLLITLLIQSFSALGMLAVPVLVPVEAGLNGTGRLSPTGIGIYLLCAYLGAVLGSLSCGPFVERWGAIRTSQVALLLTGSGLGLAALFPELIFVAALLVGLGYGPITPASSHVLIQTTPARQRNLVFSVKQTGVPVGVGLSGFCIPPLSASGGWVGTLLWLGLACALVAASAQWIQAELDARTSPFSRSTGSKSGLARFAGFPAWIRHMSAPVSVITHHRSLRSLAAVSFVLSGIQISFTSYLVSFLTSELLMPTLFAGSVLGLSQLGGIVGRILFGFLSDRYVNPLVMLMAVALTIALAAFVTAMLSAGASAAGTFALTGSTSDIWLALLMFVFGASASGWNGIYLAEVARRAPPGMAGTATSGALACTFVGVLIGAPVFGFIVTTSGGFGGAFAMQSILALGVAGLLCRFRKSMADSVVRSIS